MSVKNDSIKKSIEVHRDTMDSIMPAIESSLKDKDYEFTSNIKKTEFIIKSTDVEGIRSLILDVTNLSKTDIGVLLTIKKYKESIYLRQRVK